MEKQPVPGRGRGRTVSLDYLGSEGKDVLRGKRPAARPPLPAAGAPAGQISGDWSIRKDRKCQGSEHIK